MTRAPPQRLNVGTVLTMGHCVVVKGPGTPRRGTRCRRGRSSTTGIELWDELDNGPDVSVLVGDLNDEDGGAKRTRDARRTADCHVTECLRATLAANDSRLCPFPSDLRYGSAATCTYADVPQMVGRNLTRSVPAT